MQMAHIDGVQSVEPWLDASITDFIDRTPGLLFLLHINPAQELPPGVLIPC
jgi:hypothetical protein